MVGVAGGTTITSETIAERDWVMVGGVVIVTMVEWAK
jgi:hypothetical protein